MKKILVSIYVLCLDRSFDIELPINLPMTDVLELIQTAISEMSGGAYVTNINAKLYEGNTGNLVNMNNIVKYSGIRNGGKIMLV